MERVIAFWFKAIHNAIDCSWIFMDRYARRTIYCSKIAMID
ncbi:hypothetical protein [Bartonella schoenbuchensis]